MSRCFSQIPTQIDTSCRYHLSLLYSGTVTSWCSHRKDKQLHFTMVVSKYLYHQSAASSPLVNCPPALSSLDIVIYFKNTWWNFEIIIILICIENSSQIYCARGGFSDYLVLWPNAFYFTDKDMRSPERLSALLKVTQQVSPGRFAV